MSTVGRDEAAVREYIQRQEEQDKRVDQLNMWRNEPPEAALSIQPLVSG